MKGMKFSIIVPVYNVEKYLKECIDSLVGQSYLPFEIILIDDGSKDSSSDICDEYLSRYKGLIKVIHKENEGALVAREIGISIATGDYFIFVDSDDYLRRDALEIVAKEIEKNNSDCVIIGMCSFWDNKFTSWDSCQKSNYTIDNKCDLYKLIFSSMAYNSMCRKIFKASVFSDKKFQTRKSIVHGEDLLRSLPLIKKVNRVSILKEDLYYYRQNPNSVTHSTDNKKLLVNNFCYVGEQVLDFLKNEGMFDKDDYSTHRNIKIKAMVVVLFSITQCCLSNKEKKELFKELRNSNYFLTFLSKQKLLKISNKKDKIVYFLFKLRMYRLIILLNKVYNKCKTRKAKVNED